MNLFASEVSMSNDDRLVLWRRRYYLTVGHRPNGNVARHVRFTRPRSEYITWSLKQWERSI